MKLMDTIKGIFAKIKYSALENSNVRKYWYIEFLVVGLLIVVLILYFTDKSTDIVNISIRSKLEIIKESGNSSHDLYYKNGAYRIDYTYFDSSIVLLGYRDSEDKWLLDTKTHMFKDVDPNDTIFFDPMIFTEDIENMNSFEKGKKVEINDIKARLFKVEDSLEANIEILCWEKFNFPLNIKYEDDSLKYEAIISEIIDIKRDNSFFSVPSNYEYSDTFSSRFYKYIRPILNTEQSFNAPCGITLGSKGILKVNTIPINKTRLTIATRENPAIVECTIIQGDSVIFDSLKTIRLTPEDFATFDLKNISSMSFSSNETVDIIIDQYRKYSDGAYYEYFIMPGVIRHLECLPHKKASVLIESKGQDHLKSNFVMKTVYFKNDNRIKEEYAISLNDREVKLWEFDVDRSPERIIISMSNSGGVAVIIDQR